MSVPVSTVWQDLLQSKAGECGPHLPKEQLASRKEFVSAVERAANDENQRNVQPELIRLGHAYMKVRKFAKAASDPFQDNLRPDDLLRPVWNIAFVVIKRGLALSVKLGELVDYITELDGRIPEVDACVNALADVPDLHAPLQAIFCRHIEAYLKILNLLDKGRKKDIHPYIQESGAEFARCRAEYEKLRRFATQVVRLPGRQEAAASDVEYLDEKPVGSRSAFAQVFAVREKTTELIYAMKRILATSSASSATSPESVHNEMGIMRKLNHHHIATLAFATQDSQGFCLYITPLAECDLGGYLRLENDRPRHHKEKVWKWFGCLLGALEYAHRNKVKHKDIKPENILIDEDGSRVYLTDFGLSRDFSNLGNSMTTRSPPLGTRMYFAPECISDGKRTTAVDIFALGCVFAEILGAIGGQSREAFKQKREGWGGAEFQQCLEKIVKEWLSAQKPYAPQDKEGKYLIIPEIRRMLEVDAEDRPTAATLLGDFKDPQLRCKICSS